MKIFVRNISVEKHEFVAIQGGREEGREGEREGGRDNSILI